MKASEIPFTSHGHQPRSRRTPQPTKKTAPSKKTGPVKTTGSAESQATALVRLVHEGDIDLWHSPAGEPFLTTKVVNHHEHHALASRGARDYLTHLFYVETKKVPHATALQDALNVLSGFARFNGGCHDVHVRVAHVAD